MLAPKTVASICLAVIAGANARALDLDTARFATAKENQVRELAEAQTNKVPSIVSSFFDAACVFFYADGNILQTG
jgi:hypothetical protein